jgi:hypothetical protein
MLHLTPATKGIGYIAFACGVGIIIRLIQAELHHRFNANLNELSDPLE